jgi:hypothetical protein
LQRHFLNVEAPSIEPHKKWLVPRLPVEASHLRRFHWRGTVTAPFSRRLIYRNVHLEFFLNNSDMNKLEQPPKAKAKKKAKPSRQEEALQMIGEYAANLRAIIKKLSRKAN